MTFFLLHDGGAAILATDRKILKAHERTAVDDAATLLERAREHAQAQQARCAKEQSEAHEHGYREGREEGRAAFSQAIVELARQAEKHRQAEEREIAALALSALRRMIDDIGNAEMMAGLAKRAVAAVIGQGEIRVHAAPQLCSRIAETLRADEATCNVPVLPDHQLAEYQCRIAAGGTRIIADLPVQFSAIEKRWSVGHGD